MIPWQPNDVIACFAAHLAAGNLAELAAMYEPDAVYLPRPGQPVSGEQIKTAFAELLTMQPTMTGAMERALVAGDLALVNNSWRIKGMRTDRRPFRHGGISTVVLRKRADGTWGVVIDDPWALPAKATR